MHVAPSRLPDESSLASARRWQSEAQCLRELAEASYLTEKQSATLRRQAEAAVRQAAWWLGGVERP